MWVQVLNQLRVFFMDHEGANEDEVYREDGSRVVKTVDRFEDVLQTTSTRTYFATNSKKIKFISNSKQMVFFEYCNVEYKRNCW